ncbi:uncoupling protein 2 [Actinidia rufa]|uniref:Uncoupling protein 2 n=1 Tax=Actinidia rufa TaxID=165716 RepID=A0A7J0DQ81_9ERIC|nr:uncoupling protein 2 [Actinidia rufa]
MADLKTNTEISFAGTFASSAFAACFAEFTFSVDCTFDWFRTQFSGSLADPDNNFDLVLLDH